jgi:allantoate deiminase
VRQETPAVPMDSDLSTLLERAVEESGVPAKRLSSGAGHDAAQVAALAPAAMLFVRCERGISHNPAESVEREDVGAAIEVMRDFISLVSQRVDAGTEPGRMQEGR